MATSVSQYGITWTWAEDLTVGQYNTGDYYVVAPSGLTMTSITPLSTNTAGRIINGTMLNPVAGWSERQGFDSSATFWTSSLNVARPGGNDMSVGNPLIVPAGSSLVSSISRADAGLRPQLSDAAVLTVVASAPAANSFRPPYCGTDKTSYYTTADIDYSFLKSYPPVSGTPVLATIQANFTRPWIEICTEFNAGRDIHPLNNQPDYGRDMSNEISDGVLLLHLNYSNAQKETLMIRLIQYGLDIYGAAVTGGFWDTGGAHNQGRKMPLLLAGLAFNDANILAYCDPDLHNIFAEDRQTFYVTSGTMSVTPTVYDYRQRSAYGGGATAPFTSPYTSTVTIAEGAGATVTWNNHGLSKLVPVYFTTTGTLPAPLQPNTEYLTYPDTIPVTDVFAGQWVSVNSTGTTDWGAMGLGASSPASGDFFKATGPGTGTGTVTALPQNTFRLAARDNFTTITTTSAGSGTHTAHYSMIGVADWGEQHGKQNNRDGANMNAYYRNIVSQVMLGQVLAAILCDGGEAAWNHPPLFDYMDRAFALTDLANFRTFQENMWNTYRNGAPNYPYLVSAVINAAGTTLTLTFSQSCTTGAGGSGGFTITASGYTPSLTYFSGSGSTTYAYTLDPAIPKQLGATLAYVQPGSGIEATVDGVDLASFSDFIITNNSTQEAVAIIRNWRPIRMVAAV